MATSIIKPHGKAIIVDESGTTKVKANSHVSNFNSAISNFPQLRVYRVGDIVSVHATFNISTSLDDGVTLFTLDIPAAYTNYVPVYNNVRTPIAGIAFYFGTNGNLEFHRESSVSYTGEVRIAFMYVC